VSCYAVVRVSIGLVRFCTEIDKNMKINASQLNGTIAFLKRHLAVGLMLTALVGFVAPVAAADLKSPASEKKQTAPSTLTGRIIYVDKGLRAMAVEIKGKILQINVPPSLRINKDGKIITFEDLAAGQEVTLTFRETVTGRLEVVCVAIEASPEPAEAAGGTKSSKGLDQQGPFSANPNPANIGGQIRSRNH
jgi:hypothetical protein